MKNGRMFIISGPSGSGKTTLCKQLLKVTKSLIKSVSITTRKRREGEKNGRDYVFITRKMFDYKKRAGHFLEYQKVFDNYYGTPNKSVKDLLKEGKNVLLCIDVKGAKVVARKIPKAARIFVKTPTFAILKSRLESRGTEEKEALDLRLKTAKEELKEAPNYDYIVVNDRLPSAFKRLKAIIAKELNFEER